MSEQELIVNCKLRLPSAQQALYSLYAPKMLSVCRRYVTDPEIAKDVMQEGFVKVFTKINSYTGDGCFSGWIRRIFVTTSLMYLRKKSSVAYSVSIDECENLVDVVAEGDEVTESSLNRLTADDLLRCIAKLPAGYRTVFNLYAIEGYSHGEIAKMLHIKESTSQSQLVRARKILQNSIKSMIGQAYA
jgi:RNA polymerase sigma factor (sigma-70 family)